MTTLRIAFERGRPAREAVASEPSELPGRARPLRVAQMLACAHEMQRMIERGDVCDRTELAARFGFTRARITQLLDLLLLAPDLQEEILFIEVTRGRDPIHEHALREIVRLASWREQRVRWMSLRRVRNGIKSAR